MTKRWEAREFVQKKLGRFHAVTITVDGCDTALYDSTGVSDATGDQERWDDAFLIIRDETADPEWRRITSISFALEQISINRAFGTGYSSQAAAIVELLTPDEWNQAIDTALLELWYQDRAEVSLTTYVDSNGNNVGTKEYSLPEWVKTRGQVRNIRYRNTSTGREVPVSRYRLMDVEGQVRVVIYDLPASTASYVLVIEAIHYCEELYDDLQEFQMPDPLWQNAIEVAAIHMVYKKYGNRFKATYAQDLAISERKLLEMKGKFLPTVITQNYADDEDWAGPDIDSYFASGNWY